METFEELLHVNNRLTQLEDTVNTDLLLLSSKVEGIRLDIDKISKKPLHINVIKISAVGRLKETAHSSILQHLLKHQLILDSFVKNILGIDDIKINPKNVRTAEQDRIDVSIYDNELCIIIENKVNDASEQSGQIFRYVDLALKAGYREDQIIVLYLNSNHHSKPSDYSLTLDGSRIPQIIEDNIIVKDYSQDIYMWLQSLSSIVPENEKYLLSALHQYQDYLEEYFELTSEWNNMNNKIKEEVAKLLFKDLDESLDHDYSLRINKIAQTVAQLEELKKTFMILPYLRPAGGDILSSLSRQCEPDSSLG